MRIDETLVLIFGTLGIFFVYWFFLMKREKQVEVADSVDIIVDGGYIPNTIVIKKGRVTKINFLRKDPTACLEEVILGDFNTRKYLPLNKKVTVELKPKEEGEFTYACSMNMYQGKIIIR